MAMTAAQKLDAYRFFAIAFDAAPGVTYMNQLDTAYAGGMTTQQIVNVYTTKAEFLAVYPSFFDNTQFATKLVETIVGTAASATNKAAAVADIVGAINAGSSRGDVIFTIFSNLAAKPADDAAWGATAKLLANQVAVAQYYTETLLGTATDLTTLRDVIGNVTPTTDVSTTAALAAATAASGTVAGSTFTLTTGVDNIAGTSGTDTIIAGEGSASGAHTLGSSDVVSGGAGVDTIEIKLSNHQLAPRIAAVEKVLAQALHSGNADSMNMINATGVTELWSRNSTNNLTVTNLQEKATIGVSAGVATANFTVAAATTARTGDLAVSLNAAKAANLIVNSTGTAGTVGYTSTTVDAVGTSTIATLDVGNTLATVTVTGAGKATVTNDLAATVRTIDASANAGGTDLSITNNTGNVTYTGGTGADRINFGGTLTLADKVDGGAARDTLAVTSQASIITGLQVSNVEVLELNTLNGTLEAARIVGLDEVQVTANLVAGAATVNGLTSNSTFVTNAVGDVRLNLTNAQVAGTQDTLNLKTGIIGTTNTGVDVWVSAAGVETIAYTQTNLANTGADTQVGFWDAADNVIDMEVLNVTNTAGNTVRFVDVVNTIKTVNASAAAGSVNVSISGGNSTNGVSITGGSGADTLRGGDGKDIIVAGAGNDKVAGDLYTQTFGTGGAAVAQSSTLTVANAEVGDVFVINGNNVTWTGVEVTDNAAVIAAAATAGVTVTADAFAVANAGTFTLTGANTGAAFAVPTVGATNFAGTPAIAEVSTVTISGAAVYDAADVLRVTVNGINFDVTASQGQTAAALAGTLATNITNAGQMTAVVTTVGGNSVITLTGTNATTNYTVAAGMLTEVSAGVLAVPTTATITPNDLEATETLSLVVGTNVFTTTFATDVPVTLGALVTAHGAAINALTGGTLAANGTTGAGGTATALVISNAAGAALTGGTITGAIGGGDGGTAPVVSVPGAAAITQTNNVDPLLTLNGTFTPAVPAGATTQTINTATLITGQATVDQYVAGVAASDTLTGGEGNDNFMQLSGSGSWNGTSFTTMDTITDLNLGGATGVLAVDTITLKAGVFGAFAGTDLINAGTALAMTGPSLAAAAQALFNAGGALNGSLNDVGLFTFGADTYLMVTNNMAGLDAGDVIIKVTGVTGTLDLSDITVL